MAKRFILVEGARKSWEHDRDCLYVVSDGPAPCTCPAGSADQIIEVDDGIPETGPGSKIANPSG